MATKKVTTSKRVGTKKAATKKRTTRARSAKKTTKKRASKAPTRAVKKRAATTKKPTQKHRALMKRPSVALSARRLQLSILSPFRLPINHDAILTQTARYAGWALMSIGVCIASFQIHHVHTFYAQVVAQQASTITATTATSSGATSTAPTATAPISVTLGTANPLHDTTGIRIEATDAAGVTAVLFHTASQQFITLGSGSKQEQHIWYIPWDTTMYPDGIYTLKLIVKDTSGTYDWEYGDSLVVQNTPDQQNTLFATTTTETATSSAHTSSQEDVVPYNTTTAATHLTPTTTIHFAHDGPYSGHVPFVLTVAHATSVEVYAQHHTGRLEQYLGTAQTLDAARWRFGFDSTALPNGIYTLVFKITTPYGVHTDTTHSLTIANEIHTPYTEAQQAYIDSLTVTQIPTLTTHDTHATTSTTPPQAGQIVTSATADAAIQPLLEEHHEAITEVQLSLAQAIRSGNQDRIHTAREAVQTLKQTIIDTLDIQATTTMHTYTQTLSQAFEAITIETERNERLIRSRVGDAVTADTDADGVTDYDEINLYSTNPFSADTDGDGFTDAYEIASGFNPLESTPEALVTYASPKDSGTERADILSVTDITALTHEHTDAPSADMPPAALITGTALPNSYVTLYIFSTPIMSTVRTDAAGNWSYTFDKALEDGTHEIYVGMTDNTGALIAKSKPFMFVKRAAAFTPATAHTAHPPVPSETPTLATDTESSFLAQHVILLILSFTIIVLGLALLLMGLHIKPEAPPASAQA
ncbi:MAG: Ig-like domain-containing protein [Candidatus Pacebacteria bacterium]|nr:Ig-like domain-containing protein [Candidatus Paceibacterota bacterium]